MTDLVPKVITSLTDPASQSIGNATKDLLDAIFNLILTPVRKFNIVKEHELLDFKEKINSKCSNISTENRDTSKSGIVLKAIEDSRYQLDLETMREYFSTLIANSLDSSKNQDITPAFSNTLANMSSQEANLLNKIFYNFGSAVPVSCVILKYTDGRTLYFDNFLLFHNQFSKIPLAISLLKNAGLIEHITDSFLTHDKFALEYEKFEHVYLDIYTKQLQNDLTDGKTLDIKKSFIRLTDYGKSFCQYVFS